eukprot:TRINITY_DN920_c0_g1_i1.p1 TRINITY_DN920_c0_g1~~TRINITY_DN920_c0_g1_i1.p1  ORF type:complete len:541 (+),score=135.35 TRINITY_DN920_c0_g1_i1:225-1847(+)
MGRKKKLLQKLLINTMLRRRYNLGIAFFILIISLFNHSNGSIWKKDNSIEFRAEDNKIECEVEGSKVNCNGTEYTKEVRDKPGTPMFYVDLLVSLFCVLFAGVMSGNTLGLLSLDDINLQVILNSNDETLKKYVRRIQPLVKRRHLLLCTLLIGNAGVMETLPIFLDRLVGAAPAIIISVTCVLFFGEIIPQAICSKHGLKMGYYLSPIVWVSMALFFPIAYPVAKLLDFILGHDHGTLYKRTELKELLSIHSSTYRQGKDMEVDENCLTDEEVLVIKGALDMQSKTVKHIEVPLEKVSMIEAGKGLDSVERLRLYNDGYSRVPVYEKDKMNILGYILVKELVLQKGEKELTPRDLKMIKFKEVTRDTRLYDLLKLMRENSAHMCLIVDDNSRPTGICTLEDLLEELLQSPIIDEFDTVTIDPVKQIRLARAIETLGLENNRDSKDFPRMSLDLLLRRRDDHPLTKELLRGSLDLRGGGIIKNPESGRVSLDLSNKGSRLSFSSDEREPPKKKKGKKKKGGYEAFDDKELFFDKDEGLDL